MPTEDERREYEANVQSRREILRTNPDDLSARYTLAFCLIELGRLDEAASTLEEALRIAPDDEDFLSEYGRLLVLLGRSGEAVPLLEKALGALPRSPEVWADYGDALRASGLLADAERAYRTGLNYALPGEEVREQIREGLAALE